MSRRRTVCQILLAAAMISLAVWPGAGKGSQGQLRGNPVGQTQERPRLVAQAGHGGVRCVAISPNGQLVLTGGEDHTAKLWEVETGLELRTFLGHLNFVEAVAFSQDGRRVLTGSDDGTAKLWDVKTGRELRSFPGHSNSVVSVAFSSDGRQVLTGSWDNTARLWDVETGRALRTFRHSPNKVTGRVTRVAFSPDGRWALTASGDTTAKLWDVETGREIRTYADSKYELNCAAFSPDGRRVLTGGNDGIGKLWDTETGQEVRTVGRGQADHVRRVAFTPNGRFVLTETGDKTITLWDAETGRERRSVTGHGIAGVAFFPDGRRVVTGSADGAELWDLETGQPLRRFVGRGSVVESIVFSPDGRHVLAGNGDGTAHFWDLETGQERHVAPHSRGVISLAFSPDGRWVLTGSLDGTSKLWDAATWRALRTFDEESLGVFSVAFSPDGRRVLTGTDRSYDPWATLWDVETGTELRRFQGHGDVSAMFATFAPDGKHVLTGGYDDRAQLWDAETGQPLPDYDGPFFTCAAFSPDSRRVASGLWQDNTAKIWDANTGKVTRTLEGHASQVESVAFSADGRWVLTGSDDGTAKLWDTRTWQDLRTLAGHSARVTHVAFSPDGHLALTGSEDNTTRLWNTATGRELCSLLSFRDGTWAVVDPDGRFDTNALDNNAELHWVMPDDPFHALPLEVFMRDYYEPGLLRRIMAGEQFAPLRSFADLNRAQPPVTVSHVTPEAADAGLVDVTVDVAGARREIQRGGKTVTMATGVYDLRLFRDGQIVGQQPKPGIPPGAAEETIGSWRQASAVALDPKTGKAQITFKGIKLPRQAGKETVEFTAYAFNADRVKSETARTEYTVPTPLTSREGRAYVITVGVNASEDAAFDLRFAADDAKAMNVTLTGRLLKLGEYQDVVSILLISDHASKGGQRVVTERLATKANVKAVLDVLAGRPVHPDALRQIPNAERLLPARPEDLVVISISSHGYADTRGGFYFLPYDVGTGRGDGITPALLSHAISSSELTAWLRDVDAGQMAMIVDACHSAATVQGEGFKPGPMGSRGLGQLAYDKRMRILAASQAADVAWEYEQLQHGLLTYALVHEGLEDGQADWQPKDGKVTLAEWLGFGADRVPTLDEAVRARQLGDRRTTGPRGLDVTAAPARFQRPALFDFAKTTSDVTIVR